MKIYVSSVHASEIIYWDRHSVHGLIFEILNANYIDFGSNPRIMVSERLDYASLIGAAWPIRYRHNVRLNRDIDYTASDSSLFFLFFFFQTMLHVALHHGAQDQARGFLEAVHARDLVSERHVDHNLHIRNETNHEARGDEQKREVFRRDGSYHRYCRSTG